MQAGGYSIDVYQYFQKSVKRDTIIENNIHGCSKAQRLESRVSAFQMVVLSFKKTTKNLSLIHEYPSMVWSNGPAISGIWCAKGPDVHFFFSSLCAFACNSGY